MCGNCWVNKGLASGEIPLACVMKGFVGRQKLINPSGAIQGATRGGQLAVINWRTLLGSPALTIVLPLPVALPVWPLLCPLAWPMLLPPASPVWPILLPLVLPISPLPVALPVWPCPLSRHQAKMRTMRRAAMRKHRGAKIDANGHAMRPHVCAHIYIYIYVCV